MHEIFTASNRLIAEFELTGCYRFLCGGLQAYSWNNGDETKAILRTFERGCCLRFDAEENEFVFRGVLLGVTYLFRVHPDEIRNAVRVG